MNKTLGEIYREIIDRENLWYSLWEPKPGYYWSVVCNAWIKGERPMPGGRYEDNETMPREDKDNDCFKEAKERGQLTFTLVEQDVTSPRVILQWIIENFNTANDSKLQEAFDKALAMKNSSVHRKFPYSKL